MPAVGEEPRAPLARYFPRQDLVVYVEFAGLDAHAEAWRKTAAYRLLNETTTGAMLESVAAQLVDRAWGRGEPGPATGAEVVAIAEHVLRAGFAVGINHRAGEPAPDVFGLVVRGAARGEAGEALGRLVGAMSRPAVRCEEVARPGGRRVVAVTDQAGAGLAQWTEGDDLAFSLVSPKGADAMIEALDGRRPDAVAHPTRAALADPGGGFAPVGLAFFDMAALPPLPPEAVAYGLDGLKRFEARWGFEGEALRAVLRVVAPAPRAGILAVFDQPALEARTLPPLPGGLAGFTVLSFDPVRVYDRIAEQSRRAGPEGPSALEAIEREVREATGRRIREDLLGHLGPRVAYAVMPSRVAAPPDALAALARGMVHVARATLLVEVDDPDAFAAVLDDVAAAVNRRAQAGGDAATSPVRLRPLAGSARGFTLSVPPAVVALPAGMRPAIVVGRRFVALGTTPAAAREALALEDHPAGLPPGDPLARALDRLPPGLTSLTVADTRESLLPELLANLPWFVQMTLGGGHRVHGRPLFGLLPVQGPRPEGAEDFAFRFDPDRIPSPDDLRPFLAPATYTVSVDERGLELASRESFPMPNPAALAPLALSAVVPIVRASLEARQRAGSAENLRRIGVALQKYQEANNHYPPAAIRAGDGTPLLSWRVALLPFLGEQALFDEYRRDEPWDSPHNRALVERMPPVYAIKPSAAGSGLTHYRGLIGPSAFFDPAASEGVPIAQITDGTANTVAIVEAREAVPWTKPGTELPFLAGGDVRQAIGERLLPSLGGPFPGGFHALFVDGTVRFLKASIPAQTLRALLTRDGGEVVSADSL